jgi:ferredoxin, 2Fe-2S
LFLQIVKQIFIIDKGFTKHCFSFTKPYLCGSKTILNINQKINVATVHFKIHDAAGTQKTVTVESGYSILEVAILNNIHLSHNCGGVCACSTCHVYINEGEGFLEEISDKEEDFIDRATNPRLESRLGCQCVILDDDAVVSVEIPDQSGIIAHE